MGITTEEWQPKEFDEVLDLENDSEAKKRFIQFADTNFHWKHIGYEDKNAPSRRDLQFLTSSGKVVYAEVERKRSGHWEERGRRNGYDTLHVPWRKNKSEADVYCQFNEFWDTMAIGAMQHLKKVNWQSVDTFNKKNDRMFKCPQNWFRFYTNFQSKSWYEITSLGKIVDENCLSDYYASDQTNFLRYTDTIFIPCSNCITLDDCNEPLLKEVVFEIPK